MYPEELTRPMAEELTSVGFKEMKNADAVKNELNKDSGISLVLINSVCGCAAGAARPGVKHALKISEKTNDLTQNVNFATKSSILLDFISDTPGLPTTRPLQPEQPLKAIRIYLELENAIVPIISDNQ